MKVGDLVKCPCSNHYGAVYMVDDLPGDDEVILHLIQGTAMQQLYISSLSMMVPYHASNAELLSWKLQGRLNVRTRTER